MYELTKLFYLIKMVSGKVAREQFKIEIPVPGGLLRDLFIHRWSLWDIFLDMFYVHEINETS